MTWWIDRLQSTVPTIEFSRYDLLLLLIPVAFLIAAVLITVAAVPEELAVGGAALLAAAALGDGLFRNPPRRPTPTHPA